jgi:uncharacterized protein
MSSIQLKKSILFRDTFWGRFRGLLGYKQLPKEQALVLVSCKQVHTLFMNFPILTIYLSKDRMILWVGTLYPWKIGPYIHNSYYVLETSDLDLLEKLAIGDILHFGVTSTKE